MAEVHLERIHELATNRLFWAAVVVEDDDNTATHFEARRSRRGLLRQIGRVGRKLGWQIERVYEPSKIRRIEYFYSL